MKPTTNPSKQLWTESKEGRIQRITKRLNQIDSYLDEQHETNQDPDKIPRFDTTLAKYELEALRKIAEELGDIPRTTTEPDTQEPLDITINGVNPDKI